jgi:hypothetical protein
MCVGIVYCICLCYRYYHVFIVDYTLICHCKLLCNLLIYGLINDDQKVKCDNSSGHISRCYSASYIPLTVWRRTVRLCPVCLSRIYVMDGQQSELLDHFRQQKYIFSARMAECTPIGEDTIGAPHRSTTRPSPSLRSRRLM